MIALVTGIAIAAFDVVIFDFWRAIFNSSPNLSWLSKTDEFISKPSIGCIKNLSKTHLLDLSVVNWASLISVGDNSTPTISSPWTADLPNLFLKNLLKKPSFFFFSSFCGTGASPWLFCFFFN